MLDTVLSHKPPSPSSLAGVYNSLASTTNFHYKKLTSLLLCECNHKNILQHSPKGLA